MAVRIFCDSACAVLDDDDAARGWEEVVADLCTRGIPTTSESLWVIALLEGRPGGAEAPGTAHVLVLYDHTVGDGASLCRVFADWLAAATRDVSTTTPLPPRPLAPSMATVVSHPVTRRLNDRVVAALVLPFMTPARIVARVSRAGRWVVRPCVTMLSDSLPPARLPDEESLSGRCRTPHASAIRV